VCVCMCARVCVQVRVLRTVRAYSMHRCCSRKRLGMINSITEDWVDSMLPARAGGTEFPGAWRRVQWELRGQEEHAPAVQ